MDATKVKAGLAAKGLIGWAYICGQFCEVCLKLLNFVSDGLTYSTTYRLGFAVYLFDLLFFFRPHIQFFFYQVNVSNLFLNFHNMSDTNFHQEPGNKKPQLGKPK